MNREQVNIRDPYILLHEGTYYSVSYTHLTLPTIA